MSKGKVLFQLSGSIACFKAAAAISRLVQEGYEVQTVATRSALEFIGPATLEGLTGKPVLAETFTPGQYMQHIHLMKWADVAVLCPASANAVNKLAAGIADDLVTTLALARDFAKPYLIAPAMNTQMYRHPATQRSLRQLRDWGCTVLDTGAGALACGDVGEGRLLEPDELLRAIEESLKSARFAAASAGAIAAAPVGGSDLDRSAPRSGRQDASPTGLRFLVTAGGTREAIDGVRSITNSSSGRTGAVIADELLAAGHDVTYLCAEGAALPAGGAPRLTVRTFVSFKDLDAALASDLRSHYDAVLHLAAVSDYSVDQILADGRAVAPDAAGKLDSRSGLTLHLRRNHKIVNHLREYAANPRMLVVAFKLTNGATPEQKRAAIQKLALESRADFIVHNDLQEVTATRHVASVYAMGPAGQVEPKPVASATSKTALAAELEALLAERLGKVGRGTAPKSPMKEGNL